MPWRATKSSGSSRSSDVGSRSGWDHSRSRSAPPCCWRHRRPDGGGVAQPARPQLQARRGWRRSARPGRRRRGAGASSRPAPSGRAAGPSRPRRRRCRPSPRRGRAASPAGAAPSAAPGSPPARAGRCPAAAGCSRGRSGRCRPQPRRHRLADAALDGLAVDGDAAGVGVHGVLQLLAQPRARARTAAGRPPRAARRTAAPRRRGGRGRRRRRRRSAAPARRRPRGASGRPTSVLVSDLVGELAERLADLGAEHDAAHPAHDPGERAGHRRLLAGSALVMAATTFSASGSISALQAGRVCSTHSTRDQASGPLDAGGQVGDLVEPQVGQPQRLGDGGALGLGGRLVAGGELADRALPGEVPVDRAAGPAHQLLQLGEQRHLAQQVLGGAAPADAAEQRAQAERVAGRVPPGSRRSGSRSGGPKPNGTSLMRPR